MKNFLKAITFLIFVAGIFGLPHGVESCKLLTKNDNKIKIHLVRVVCKRKWKVQVELDTNLFKRILYYWGNIIECQKTDTVKIEEHWNEKKLIKHVSLLGLEFYSIVKEDKIIKMPKMRLRN
jgi:hypothetical protein